VNSSSHLNLIASTLIFLFISLSVLQAQSKKSDELFNMSLEELLHITVSSASKVSQDIHNAPAHILVFTKEQIEERGYYSLEDLLRDLPEVDIQEYSHVFSFNRITVRGISGNSKFLVLLNGQRISSPTADIIAVKENYPLYMAKQVEIILGPSSALYGADAFSGIINIITDDDPTNEQLSVNFSAGMYHYYRSSIFIKKQLYPDINMQAGVAFHKSRNADLSSFYPAKFRPAPLVTFGGDTIVRVSDRHQYQAPTASNSLFVQLTAHKAFHLALFSSFYSSPTTNGIKPDQNAFDDNLQYDTGVYSLYADYTYHFGGKFSAKTSLSYGSYKIYPNSVFKNIFSAYQRIYKYGLGSRMTLEEQVNYRLDRKHNFTSGLVLESLSALPQTMDLSHRVQENHPLSEQHFFYPGTENTIPLKFFYLNYANHAAYLQWQTQWLNNLHSTVGFRYDHNTRYNSTIMPRLAITYSPDRKTNLKTMYGESYLAPSPYTSYDHFGSFSGQKNGNGQYISYYLHIPNAFLQPERTRTLEFDGSRTVSNDLLFNFSTFVTTMSDIILRDAYTTPSYYINGGEILNWSRYENIGQARIWGLSLCGEYHLNFTNSSLEGWANYSITDGYIIEKKGGEKLDLPYLATHKLKLGLVWNYRNAFTISPRLYWIGKTNSVWIDSRHPRRRVQVDSYHILNIHMSMNQLFKMIDLVIDINNALDTKYYNAGGSTSNAFISAPQDPILFRLGFRYHMWL